MGNGAGPLVGLRVIELAAVGPGPHAGMILADLGADVVRIDRPSGTQLGRPDASDPMLRGRRRVKADLKTQEGRDTLMSLVRHADVLMEGYRPGVVERLGVGPDECLAVNPRLVYARATGWGQSGPFRDKAGHDINYLSISGALHALGRRDETPPPPLNLVGDYGGGSMLLITGLLAALWHAGRTGRGQVVDAAMVDGVSLLAQKVWSWRAQGLWNDRREANFVDGGSPWYRTYACADGMFMAVAAIEPQFYEQFLIGLGLSGEDLPPQRDPNGFPVLTRRFEEVFASKTRDEWAEIFADLDACTTPVLTWEEAPHHPQNAERRTIVTEHGATQVAPVPRFSHTELRLPAPMADPVDVGEVLADWTDAADPTPAKES
ncbi:MAG TPA: CaiB/BaiF CoA-transferase family protein [Thermomonospora sp.]|nr:CaiB/BaiF CoA-transferase family protein [Thermomonospora sp.]